MAKKKPQADEGLDSLLGELDAMEVPPDLPDDPLDGLLDDLAELDAAAKEPVDPGAEPAAPAKRRKRRPGRMVLLAGLAALTSHAALFGLGYWLGGRGAGHGAATGEPAHEGAAPLEGVMRYFGHPSDIRVDGETIFTSPEVREAVLELDGGQALADAMAKFAARMKPVGTVTRDGDLIEAKACSRNACAAEAFSLRFNSHTHQVWVCQTVPYAGGASLSYLYGADGMEEVARCVETTPLPLAGKVPEAEPDAQVAGEGGDKPAAEAEHAAAEEVAVPAHPGRKPPAPVHD